MGLNDYEGRVISACFVSSDMGRIGQIGPILLTHNYARFISSFVTDAGKNL